MRDAHPLTKRLVLGELIGMNVTMDRTMPGRRTQILTDRDDVDPHCAHVRKRSHDLLPGLPHPHYQA